MTDLWDEVQILSAEQDYEHIVDSYFKEDKLQIINLAKKRGVNLYSGKLFKLHEKNRLIDGLCGGSKMNDEDFKEALDNILCRYIGLRQTDEIRTAAKNEIWDLFLKFDLIGPDDNSDYPERTCD